MGTLTMNAVNFPTNTAAIQVTAAGNNAFVTPTNTDYMMQVTGRDGFANRIIFDSYGTGVYSTVVGRSGRGTASAPSASQSGDVIMRFSGNAYGSATSGYVGTGVGRFELVAVDNMTSANNGSQWNLWSMPAGGNTFTTVASFNTTNVSFSNNLVVSNNITSNGNIIVNNNGLFQYTTSNNSTVTQLTSRTTPVTCNGRTGQITLFAAALNSGTATTFTVTNNQIVSASDVVIVNIASGDSAGNTYTVSTTGVTPGSFKITLGNTGHNNSPTDTLVLNFAIIRVN
jgi:hypothetical protein